MPCTAMSLFYKRQQEKTQRQSEKTSRQSVVLAQSWAMECMQSMGTCLTCVGRCMFIVGTPRTLQQHHHRHNLPLHVSIAGHDDATAAYFTIATLSNAAVKQSFAYHAGTTLTVLALTTANVPESKHQMMAFNQLQASQTTVAPAHS